MFWIPSFRKWRRPLQLIGNTNVFLLPNSCDVTNRREHRLRENVIFILYKRVHKRCRDWRPGTCWGFLSGDMFNERDLSSPEVSFILRHSLTGRSVDLLFFFQLQDRSGGLTIAYVTTRVFPQRAKVSVCLSRHVL